MLFIECIKILIQPKKNTNAAQKHRILSAFQVTYTYMPAR